jgi:hypothetical protein
MSPSPHGLVFWDPSDERRADEPRSQDEDEIEDISIVDDRDDANVNELEQRPGSSKWPSAYVDLFESAYTASRYFIQIIDPVS